MWGERSARCAVSGFRTFFRPLTARPAIRIGDQETTSIIRKQSHHYRDPSLNYSQGHPYASASTQQLALLYSFETTQLGCWLNFSLCGFLIGVVLAGWQHHDSGIRLFVVWYGTPLNHGGLDAPE